MTSISENIIRFLETAEGKEKLRLVLLKKSFKVMVKFYLILLQLL